MPNNIAVSVTADVADLQVKRAIMSAELRTAQKDLNDFAKTANTSGMTDALKTSMLGSADAVARTRNQIRGVDRELKGLAASEVEEAAASEVSTAAHLRGGVVFESMVLVHEALSGRMNRMASSSMILAQRMGLITPTVIAAAAAMVALIVPVVAVVAAMDSAHADLARFQNDIRATGNYAGLTAADFEDMAERVAAASKTGLGAARSTLLALAASGRFTGDEIEALGRDATKLGDLTGKSAKDVLADFVKMADGPTRYAEEFNRTYHSLTLAQIEHIKTLEDQGQKTEATAALVQALTHWLDEQSAHLGPLQGAWHGLKGAIDDAWQSFKHFVDGGNGDSFMSEHISRLNAEIAELQKTHGLNGLHFDNYQLYIANIEKERDALQAKATAQEKAAAGDAKAARLQAEATDAFEKSHATMQTLRSSALAAREAVQALHAEMAKRLEANPADKEAADYMAHQARYDQALMRKMDPGDHKKGPDAVAEWTAQLHAQEVASGEFFRDQTEAELKFWQGKLGLTSAGSKQYLEVQEHIYTAQKTLAHQAYTDQLALLDEQLQADRDNWAKEQADWNAKLAFIKTHYGAESSEYRNADREFVRAEQEHEQRMAQVRRQAAQTHLAEVQDEVKTEQEIRARALQTQEAEIKAAAQYGGNPFAGVGAEQQIAQLQAKAIQQQIDALTREHLVRSEIAAQELADAKQAYGVESEQYAKAIAEKSKLDSQFFNQHRLLIDQAANHEIQAQQRIKAAWHSAIDPLVQAAGSNIRGLVEGTETWRQALVSVGEAALDVVVGALEKIAERMIVNAITGRATQVASAEAGVAANAAVAGAAGVASMAAAPFPIDLTAPAFGAQMAAAALAFGTIGGFERGLDVVPQDMVAQIHEGERIIPKADNRAIIAALGGGATGTQTSTAGGGGHGGGAIQVTIQAMDARSFQHFLDQNGDALQRTLQRQLRNMRQAA